MISANNVTYRVGKKALFEDVNIKFTEGNCYGLIGANGAGKSTFLKILSGQLDTTKGDIVITPGQRLSVLEQDHFKYDDNVVMDTVIMGNERLFQIMKEKDAIYAKEDFSDEDGIRASELEAEFAEMDGWEAESNAAMLLNGLGIGTEFHYSLMKDLDGSLKVKVLLAKALFGNPDILLLDEPTNHLDNSMSDWLEEQLRRRKGAMIMVTHDRYFLDSVTDRILELDKGKIYSYDANYSGYLELKMQREEMAQASEKKRLNILRNELAWVQRGARARSTKQKARLQRFEELKNVKGPVTDGKVELASAASRLGRTTVEIENVSKSYGDKVLIRDFTYLFGKDDRVGFIGPNGSGKTTLMKMILGEVAPDSGHIEIGQTVKLGYYAQEIDDTMMHPEQRVIDYIRDVAEYIITEDGQITAARMLERFLFSGEDQYGQLGKLSGGERRRLQLCKVLMGAPNVLILDEPTNDLDIATLQVLEDYLDTFPGIVIVVSHDRYFLDRVVRRIFALEDTRMVQYEGGYTDYANRKAAEGNTESTGTAAASQPKNADEETTSKNWKNGQKRKLKFTYQEQKDYESIEGEMAALEDKIATLEADFSKYASDFVKLNELTQEKEAAEQQLEEKMERWMYLEDLAARIERGEEN